VGWQSIWKLAKSDYLKLVPILGLAFYTAFIPHLSYPYPIHIDDWMHLALSRAIQSAGSVNFVDPFAGAGIRTLATNLETGYQVFWSVFQQISGISWMTIFRYFPSVVLMITALSAYTLGRREGFGWQAAFFVCLIPTTIGILGPAFMVPVAMGLLFIPLSMFTVFHQQGISAYLVLFIFTAFLLAIHAPSAIILGIILGPYILLSLRRHPWHSLGMAAALLIPFLAPFPWIVSLLGPTFKTLFEYQPLPFYVSFPQIIKTYGYIPIALCLLGTFLLAIKGGRRNYSLLLGLLALLLMLVVFYTFGYGVSIVYERGLMFAMMTVSMVAGAGLAGVAGFALPEMLSNRLRMPLVTQNLGKTLCLILIIVILVIAIPDRLKTPYYHVIDEQDYADFAWIEENIGAEYQKAILDPWKATPFTALTGKAVYTRLHTFPQPTDEEARKFLNDGSVDTDFLKKNGISIVYSRGEVKNPDLTKVRENVYLLKK
jgi:hypothetical protein